MKLNFELLFLHCLVLKINVIKRVYWSYNSKSADPDYFKRNPCLTSLFFYVILENYIDNIGMSLYGQIFKNKFSVQYCLFTRGRHLKPYSVISITLVTFLRYSHNALRMLRSVIASIF
jgi:hypothetical protein